MYPLRLSRIFGGLYPYGLTNQTLCMWLNQIVTEYRYTNDIFILERLYKFDPVPLRVLTVANSTSGSVIIVRKNWIRDEFNALAD